jgi:uncharacterized damage-inducible protein DinB
MTDSLIEVLKKIFKRDLNKLKHEIGQYKDEATLWLIREDISNSAGNLCLHLIGNLNMFISAEYGNTGYIRQRELEFSLKNVSRERLIEQIDQTIIDVVRSLDNISNEQLIGEYPQLVFKHKTTTEYFLIHLIAHFSYHLGQINYHRRLLNGKE